MAIGTSCLPSRSKLSLLARLIVFAWFAIGGIAHFMIPNTFMRIMPPYIPYPMAMIYWSGVFELLGAIGILTIAWREMAGNGLIMLTCAVTLANVHMLQHPALFPTIPYWVLVLRLPVQALLLWLIWWSTRECPTDIHYPLAD